MKPNIDALGRRVIVQILEEGETTKSGIILANTQGARCKGRIVSVGSEAKKEEPKLEPGKLVLYYKQPPFKVDDVLIAEFDYEKLIGIIEEN